MLDQNIDVETLKYPHKKHLSTSPLTIIELIKQQDGNRQALKLGDQFLTFKELEERSDKLAIHLRQQGVLDEQKVVVMLPLSFELVISIYAILKAGGCYVPLNASDGINRFEFIMSDLLGHFVIGNQETLRKVKSSTTASLWEINLAKKSWITNFRDPEIAIDIKPTTLPNINPNNLAYIIYTSGTTGRPKGVMVEHHNIHTFIISMRKAINVATDDRWLLNPNLTFDMSVGTMFLSLCNGATLVLRTGDLHEILAEEKITHYNCTPGAATLVDPSKLPHLKDFAVGGEKVPDELIARFSPFCNIYDTYGPAEATINVSWTYLNNLKTSHIGTTLPGVDFYVVTPEGKLATNGESGELWVAGDFVVRGYLNRPKLTAEKFILNPFGPNRVYKTGDKVRWMGPGIMEFQGRIDRQVKIRGHRLELDEIEKTINRFPGIKATLSKVLNDNLVAYVTPKNVDLEGLFSFLKAQLPKYAIPASILTLDSFPLNRSGKIDTAALLNPFHNQEGHGESPITNLEKEITSIWETVLFSDLKTKIYLDDNFFDLGGNSLHILKVMQKIRKYYANPKIPVELLYKNTVLKDFIAALKNWQHEVKTNKHSGNISLSLLKCLPTTVYFALGFIFPFTVFSILAFKFPILFIYAILEYLVFKKIFGPISLPFLRKIIYSSFWSKISFKKIEIIEEEPLENIQGNLICLHPHGVCDIHLYPLATRLWQKSVEFKAAFEKHVFSLPFNRTLFSLTGNVPATEETYHRCKQRGENLIVTPDEQPGYLNSDKPGLVAIDSKLDFFKMAIKTGMPLIPVFVFNLNKHFNFYPELLPYLDKLPIDPNMARFIMPYSGRWLTPLPFRHNLKMVTGKAIPVRQNANPSYKEILEVKNQYKKELERIFKKHKPQGHAPLEII